MGSALAIVSPCSTCKNQNVAAGTDGKPQCPRRYWQSLNKNVPPDLSLATGPVPDTGAESYPLLALTGNERDGDTTSTSLVNPVYWNDGNSILVWVAKLKDNSPIVNNGQVVNNDILSDSFDTSYINCCEYPYVPVGNENEYFQRGALKESDQIVVTDIPCEQLFGDTFQGTPFGGTLQRANFFFNVPRVPTDDHQCPEGV